MNHTHLLNGFLCAGLIVIMACNNSGSDKNKETTEATTDNSGSSEGNNPKGIGPHQNIQLTHPLDKKMAGGRQECL